MGHDSITVKGLYMMNLSRPDMYLSAQLMLWEIQPLLQSIKTLSRFYQYQDNWVIFNSQGVYLQKDLCLAKMKFSLLQYIGKAII